MTVMNIKNISRSAYPPNEIVRLHMLSGGLDSCAALLHDLRHTDFGVHAHHIVLQTPDNRHEAESRAVEKIVSFCREKYRNFVFTSNSFSWPVVCEVFPAFPKDSFIVNTVAGGIAYIIKNTTAFLGQKPKIQYVVTLNQDELCPHTWEEYFSSASFLAFQAGFQSFFYDSLPPEMVFPFIDKTKKDLAATIPEELKPHIASCRRPQKIHSGHIPCGICHTCKLIMEEK